MPTTPLGYPYPDNTDPVDIVGDIGDLATAIDTSTGITPLTQTQIDALTTTEAREGRVVFNLTTGLLQQRTNTSWVNVSTVSDTQTLTNKTLTGVANTITDLPATAITGTAVVQADLTTHAADTTNVHGITDTTALETKSGAQAKATAAQTAAAAYTDTAISNLVGTAPAVLDTLEEIADAINNDDNFTTTVTNSIAAAVANLENYADQAETDAITAAAAYTDSELATATTAHQAYTDAAEADAVTAANTYTDTQVAVSAANLSSHAADTTGVHGITDTANLVYTNDTRLSNARTPNPHNTTHATAGSDPIAPADIGAATASHTHNYLTPPASVTTGDLLVGTGSGTFTRLPYSNSDGYVLTATAGAVAWAEPTGDSGGAALSDTTPAALGTPAAGVAVAASRSDHVHADPLNGIQVTIGGSEPSSTAGYFWLDTTVEA